MTNDLMLILTIVGAIGSFIGGIFAVLQFFLR